MRPRIDRGGLYPFARAGTNVIARDVVVSAVIEDMLAGRACVYADFLGYDEVAHHSGIERFDALAVLREIDRQIGRLYRATELAPRRYLLVALSDHGQTQGEAFTHRFGESVEELVGRLCGGAPAGRAVQARGAQAHRDLAGGRGVRRGDVRRWPGRAAAARPGAAHPPRPPAHARPASPAWSRGWRRAWWRSRPGTWRWCRSSSTQAGSSWRRSRRSSPTCCPRWSTTPASGSRWCARPSTARSCSAATACTGSRPVRCSARTRSPRYGPHAAELVRRVDGFPHCPDVMINSRYDPMSDDASPFEVHVGSHGGMGGPQSRGFLLYPTVLPAPAQTGGEIVGAEALHRVFRGWLTFLGHPAADQPSERTGSAAASASS